jgi:hypothetical protein
MRKKGDMSTLNLNDHVIAESSRNGVWTYLRATSILASNRVKQNGDINKLHYVSTKVLNNAEAGPWVKDNLTKQQLEVEVPDYYQGCPRPQSRHQL